ncbi:glycoside hydrolase family 3 protein [Arthrospiribacter ruber]|uniref:Glycoside hydrolase family 3 protein n=1 Tax=Arthrospiribacter ruber TaxID=2487934 RepID=A0A951IXD1_9BACT|nr:glycoside hydrolase family 3 protein [Arthrospiribacter ruber]MBW3467198.1 glycoside hydrolase family 3 protein [Arthrospiribacter ruber]
MTIKEKIGQLFSPAAFIHDTEENIQSLERLINEHKIGGLTFFHSRHSAAANFEQRQEKLSYENTLEKLVELINRYQLVSKIPLLISIDAEYGLAMRVENTPQYPYAISLGNMDKEAKELIYDTGKRMAKDLKASGIHLNFAPVADINTNPNNPVIGYRSFGNRTEKVSEFAWQMYKGHTDQGVGACYKHFPGHGDTDVDSHLGLPILYKNREALEKEELLPFLKGIEEGIDMIMVGHLAIPELTDGKEIPASISKAIITDLLKKEMGYEGLVVSDALNMRSVADLFTEPGQLELEAFLAGNDLLCFSENIPEAISLISEKAPEEKIDESFRKIMKWKEKYGVLEAKKVTVPSFDWGNHAEFLKKTAPKYLSELLAIPSGFDFKNCLKISLHENGENHFFQQLEEHCHGETFQLKDFDLENPRFKNAEWVLSALFVPSAKPINHFGLDKALMEKLVNLSQQKNTCLYVFGNHLALREFSDLSDFKGIICAGQQFEEVQKTAALHLLGKVKAEGSGDISTSVNFG